MVAIIETQRPALAELCRKYGVEKLCLFGLAISDHLDGSHGDLDFLVRFADREPTGEYADRYLGFADDLENLFNRRVDLVTEQSIRNPYLLREIESTRQLVYGQPHKETAV